MRLPVWDFDGEAWALILDFSGEKFVFVLVERTPRGEAPGPG